MKIVHWSVQSAMDFEAGAGAFERGLLPVGQWMSLSERCVLSFRDEIVLVEDISATIDCLSVSRSGLLSDRERTTCVSLYRSLLEGRRRMARAGHLYLSIILGFKRRGDVASADMCLSRVYRMIPCMYWEHFGFVL